MSPSIGSSERLRRTERVISFIRLAVVLFNVATYQLMAPESDRRGLANAICVIASIYAIATILYRPTKERSYAAAYTNTVLDNLFIGIWLYSTDGFASPFYPLFYAEAAASVGRFGPVAGNLSAAASASIYAVVVGIDGFAGVGYELSVRIAYIFVVSAFVSYVVEIARRSEREAAEAEREAAAYMELDRLRSTFVTNISHELRTPLTAIRGAASTLARRDLPEPERSTLIEMIDRQSERLAGLVQDIIDIGLAEQGKLVPRFARVDLNLVVQREVEEARDRTERGIDLKVPEEASLAYCDGSKIGNALSKVLDNALKFSDPDSPVLVAVEADGQKIRLTVTDKGIGIAPSDVEHIFDRFHQLDPSHTRSAGGTGVGLSIAKAIVDLHGGDVEVKSQPGSGTIVTIAIPRDAAQLELDQMLKDSPSL